MKKGLRFITALLTLGSMGIWFLPVLTLGGIEVSIIDVFTVGVGYYDRNSMKGMIYSQIQTYIESYSVYIAAAAVIIFIEALLIAALGRRAAYIWGILVSLINIAAFAALYYILDEKLGEFQTVLVTFLGNEMALINYEPLYAWIALYALIVILSIIGIILWRKPKEKGREEIYLEQIRQAEAGRARRQRQSEPYSRREYREQTSGQPNPRYQDSQAASRPEQDTEAWVLPEQKSTVPTETFSAQAVKKDAEEDMNARFSGAVVCEGGEYAGKAYPLQDKKEVFFFLDEGTVQLRPYEEEGAAAGIYYIGEYGEYCAEPFEKNILFLESGQPLGKGRQYYLPRGIKVYIGTRENTFTLA